VEEEEEEKIQLNAMCITGVNMDLSFLIKPQRE
jgi:hypothetical protein